MSSQKLNNELLINMDRVNIKDNEIYFIAEYIVLSKLFFKDCIKSCEDYVLLYNTIYYDLQLAFSKDIFIVSSLFLFCEQHYENISQTHIMFICK